MVLLRSLVILTSSLLVNVQAVNQTVQLSYASYSGAALNNGVTQWLGMRYAKPPLGDLRYAAPQDPDSVTGVQPAVKRGKWCLAVGKNATETATAGTTSEDCLFIDVFAPTTAKNDSNFPVYFFIQGGGFASNANPTLNASGLINASGNNIVVVTFNYRVGPYGFLAGKEVSSFNNGLKDQRKALQWVHDNIVKFGGDPGHVTLGGDSAGAASITLFMTANGGQATNLFHAAAGESASFGPVLDISQSQYEYDAFVKSLGCSGTPDTLACLRSKSANETQDQNEPITFPKAPGPPIYSWSPVIDGTLIQDITYRAFRNGKFVKVPVIFGADNNDGTLFADNCSETSQTTSNNFIRKNFYNVSQSQLDMLNQLYPNKPRDFPQCGSWWRQAADVYGEIRYLCPSLFLNDIFTQSGSPSWNYRYNVQDPAQVASGLGVPHTVEVSAIFGPTSFPASYKAGQSNADIVPIIQGYWTSFVRSFDPNKFRVAGTAVWNRYNSTAMDRLQFATPPNTTAMETVDPDQWKRCQYIFSIAESLQQ